MMMTTNVPSNTDDYIDVRDVIERFEELRTEAYDAFVAENPTAADCALVDEDYSPDGPAPWSSDPDEYKALAALLEDLNGYGGDHQWEGDWYPATLVRDSHFEDYARELAEEIGAIPRDYSWPTSHIDWEAAARALQMDYSSVEFQGVTYWYR